MTVLLATQVYLNPSSWISVVDLNLIQLYDVRVDLINTLGQSMRNLSAGVIQNTAYEIDMRTFTD